MAITDLRIMKLKSELDHLASPLPKHDLIMVRGATTLRIQPNTRKDELPSLMSNNTAYLQHNKLSEKPVCHPSSNTASGLTTKKKRRDPKTVSPANLLFSTPLRSAQDTSLR